MKNMIKALLGSKKAWATVTGVIVWVIGRWVEVDPADLLPVVAAIATFVLAQGFADKGKEATKLDNAHTLDLLAKEAGEPGFVKDE